ncbi:dihydrolipoamide acetyltransferase family protein [Microvirga sp. 2YAF29]|uniref:dihydrolipoamide acetyltransferase family protein n=1 Tax=Microvirga sp. 2YAF29 TaxID=3233031 RepID=UPI003F9650B7
MSEHVIKMPDVGEGVAEAELVEWHVKVGDLVREDTILAAVMTDKATVEIPSPVHGEVTWLGGDIGDVIPIGSPLIRLKIEGEDVVASSPPSEVKEVEKAAPSPAAAEPAVREKPSMPVRLTTPRPPREGPSDTPRVPRPAMARGEGDKPIAPPSVRHRAREAGLDLRQIPGTGPAGRITHEDLDAFMAHGVQTFRGTGLVAKTAVEQIKVVGLRRKIAEKMAISKSRIPHITYVEEVDVTALEDLRSELNASKRADRPKLTLLPFLMRAMVKAIAEQPRLNSIYDDEAGIIHQHEGVHIGIATQTDSGLVVPVVRHTEALDLWECAIELKRLTDAAKDGTSKRDDLTGSTITITSLGAMGGIVTTPVINYPEVAIIGVNKMVVRPVWDGSTFVPRKVMNLSSSFDHRVVDGWDAAVFIQRIKTLLETPAMIFVEA